MCDTQQIYVPTRRFALSSLSSVELSSSDGATEKLPHPSSPGGELSVFIAVHVRCRSSVVAGTVHPCNPVVQRVHRVSDGHGLVKRQPSASGDGGNRACYEGLFDRSHLVFDWLGLDR